MKSAKTTITLRIKNGKIEETTGVT